jgi:hypothetical protein
VKNYLKQYIWRSFGWIPLVGVACLSGCQTTDQADSGQMASVTISGHTDAEIQQAAAKAFVSNGYQQVKPRTFEKQGTSWDKVAYGGWSSNPVWIRMRINITSLGPGQSILACDAFAVVDRNEATMEEEKKLSVSYRSDCKKILDQAKATLDLPPDGTAQ